MDLFFNVLFLGLVFTPDVRRGYASRVTDDYKGYFPSLLSRAASLGRVVEGIINKIHPRFPKIRPNEGENRGKMRITEEFTEKPT